MVSHFSNMNVNGVGKFSKILHHKSMNARGNVVVSVRKGKLSTAPAGVSESVQLLIVPGQAMGTCSI